VEKILKFCEDHDLHLVVDEIYALSIFGDSSFTSIGELLPSFGERVHGLWGFSKDLSMSGIRFGVLITGTPRRTLKEPIDSFRKSIRQGLCIEKSILSRRLWTHHSSFD
jgi:aspartate/methionine/tyrosine aminotransferase